MEPPPFGWWWGVSANRVTEQTKVLPTRLCFMKVSLNSFSNALGMHGDIDML